LEYVASFPLDVDHHEVRDYYEEILRWAKDLLVFASIIDPVKELEKLQQAIEWNQKSTGLKEA